MEKGKKLLILAGTGMVVYFIFRFLFFMLLPVVLALAAGKLLEPVVRFLHKKCKFPWLFCVVVVVFGFFGGVGVLLYYGVEMLCQQTLGLCQQLPDYMDMAQLQVDRVCSWCDRVFFMEDGTSFSYACMQFSGWCEDMGKNGAATVSRCLLRGAKSLFSWVGTIGFVVLMTCMLVLDMDTLRKKYRDCAWHGEAERLLQPLTKVGFAYIRAQLILIFIVAVVCTLGFYFTGSSYGLLFGILVAIVDAFPILGSGLFFVPAILFAALTRNWVNLAVYGVTFLLCQVVRQFLEPKLIGDGIGIHPFLILLSVYFGLELFGIPGVFTGPVALVFWRALFESVDESVCRKCA